MKKISLILILVIALVLGACNLPSSPAGSPKDDTQPTLPPVEEEGLATPIEEGNIELLPTNTAAPTNAPVQPTNTAVAVQPTKEQVAPPTQTPLPKPTQTPTVKPTDAAEDVNNGDPAVFNGSVDWQEQFEDAAVTIPLGEATYSKAEVVNEQLVFAAKFADQPAWRTVNAGQGALGASYFETAITNVACHSDDDSAGIFFRSPDVHDPDQGYLFGITCGGEYFVKMWNGKSQPGGQMSTIIAPTASEQIRKGSEKFNRIGVLSDAKGRSILYINGQPVDEFTSPLFVDGHAGLMIIADTDAGYSVQADYFKVWYEAKLPTISHASKPSNTGSSSDLGDFAFSNFISDPFGSGDPSVVLGDPTWRDQLNSAANWGAYLNEYAIWTGNAYGELVVTGNQKQAAWVLANTPKIGDGAIELVIDNDDCYMWDSYGMFFRAPSLTDGDRGYLFGTTCHAQYFVWRWDGKSGRMEKLVDYTRDIDHINYGANQRNRFNIVTVGDTINFYINGYYLTTVTDDYWTEGYFGVFVRPQYDGGLTIRLDEASYWIND